MRHGVFNSIKFIVYPRGVSLKVGRNVFMDITLSCNLKEPCKGLKETSTIMNGFFFVVVDAINKSVRGVRLTPIIFHATFANLKSLSLLLTDK